MAMKYRFDEYVEMLDERLDRFTKMLDIHREIEDENERKLKEWKEGRNNG